jgi:hypothetical protein
MPQKVLSIVNLEEKETKKHVELTAVEASDAKNPKIRENAGGENA